LAAVALSAPAPACHSLCSCQSGASASIALARFAPYTQKMADKIRNAFAAINLVFKGFYILF
jgi:hypothetical protein